MSPTEASNGWLRLLVDDAPWSVLTAYRDAQLESSSGATRIARGEEAAAAFEIRAQLDQRLRRAVELSVVNEVAVRLATERDLESLLRAVVDHARRVLQVDIAYAGRFVEGQFVIGIASGAISASLPGLRFPQDAGLAGEVRRTGAPVWTPNYQTDPAFAHMRGSHSAAVAEDIRGVLGVPLTVGASPLGALFVGKRTQRSFTESEISLLSALAAHAAIAIENADTLARYHGAITRLESVNAELTSRTAELEQAIEWDHALSGVVLRGGGVARLVDLAGRLLGRTVHFVAQATSLPDELAPVATQVLELLDTLAESEVDQAHSGDATMYAYRVRAEKRRLGALVVIGAPPGPPAPSDELLLSRVAPAIALLVDAERFAAEATQRARDAHLINLLTQPASDADESRRQCRHAGVDPDRPYLVVIAVNTDDEDTTPQLTPADLPTGTVLARSGARAIALVPGTDPDAVAALLGRDDRSSTIGSSTLGVAGHATGARSLATAYKEAQQTCDVLVTLGRTGQLSTASGLGIYRVLLHDTGRREILDLAHRRLEPLLTEESKRGTPLVDTLSAYLTHGRRHVNTAEALHIHVNTLYQRLDTIDRLLGTQWRDPDAALDLHLILRLRRSSLLLATTAEQPD